MIINWSYLTINIISCINQQNYLILIRLINICCKNTTMLSYKQVFYDSIIYITGSLDLFTDLSW